jgi:hypothetical protein
VRAKLSVVFKDSDGATRRMPADFMRRVQVRALVYSFEIHHDRERLVEEIAALYERWEKAEAQIVARAGSAKRWKKKRPARPAWMQEAFTAAFTLLQVQGHTKIGRDRLIGAADNFVREGTSNPSVLAKRVKALTDRQARLFLDEIKTHLNPAAA